MMAECKYPIHIEDPKWQVNRWRKRYMMVPCGKCVKCMQTKSRQWIFRLEQEKKVSSSAYFVTLTYNDDSLLWTSSGVQTLYKPDFQNFMKRLRKMHEKVMHVKLKYFACGEYGTETKRPHYHVILFNAERQLIDKAWNNEGENSRGITHIGTVTQDSMAYCTKYIMKENREWQLQFEDDPEFQPEFSLKSKGLGKSYSDSKAIRKYHTDDLENRTFVRDSKGKRVAMPRYYKDKIYDEEQLEIVHGHQIKTLKNEKGEKLDKFDELDKEGKDPWSDELKKKAYNDQISKSRLRKKSNKL